RNAAELASDLRRYTTGQLVGAHRYSLAQLVRRWMARHKTALVVACVAAVALAAVAGLAVHNVIVARKHAETQRARAEVSRGDAEDLTRFMLFDLHDKLE